MAKQQTEQDIQTQHVLTVAHDNLAIVIDQLTSLDDSEVNKLAKELKTNQNHLEKILDARLTT